MTAEAKKRLLPRDWSPLPLPFLGDGAGPFASDEEWNRNLSADASSIPWIVQKSYAGRHLAVGRKEKLVQLRVIVSHMQRHELR